MNIRISNTGEKPIYQQILEQIKASIITGDLAPGEQLPSIRYLAKELRVSVITTKRAYDNLEQDGFIYSVQGKGSYVSDQNQDILKEEYLQKMEENLSEALRYGQLAGLDLREIIDSLKILEECNE